MAPVRTLLLALALLLLGSGGATAAPRVVTSFVPSSSESSGGPVETAYSGPFLAGGQVAWTRNLHAGGWVVERGAPGARVKRIATVARPAADHHFVRMRGASAARTAYTDYAFDILSDRPPRGATIRNLIGTSTLAPGSSQDLVGCGGASQPPCACQGDCYPDELQGRLEGDTLAYVEGSFGDAVIVVDDLASPAAPVRIDRDAAIYGLRVAGSMLAWAESGAGRARTVVYDWRAGRELYTVDGVFPQALQADGKIATLDSDWGLSWHGPAEPAGHRIERPAGTQVSRVRLAADRLLFVEGGSGPTRLLLAGLSGGVAEVASRYCCGGDAPFANLDFDGTRATWASFDCGLVAIVLEPDVTRAAPGRPASTACGARPPELSQIKFASGGRLAARMTCEKGCRGAVALYEAGRSSHSRLARRTVDLRPSKRPHWVYFTPSAPVRKRIAKLAQLRVQGVFSGRDGPGRRVADTRTGTLKRP
jgi:hypothetical protein